MGEKHFLASDIKKGKKWDEKKKKEKNFQKGKERKFQDEKMNRGNNILTQIKYLDRKEGKKSE